MSAIIYHTCKSCLSTMDDASFQYGKMCCDKPLFGDDIDMEDEECGGEECAPEDGECDNCLKKLHGGDNNKWGHEYLGFTSLCDMCYEDMQDDAVRCSHCNVIVGSKNDVCCNTCCICQDITLCDDCCPDGTCEEHHDGCWDECKEYDYPHKVCKKCTNEGDKDDSHFCGVCEKDTTQLGVVHHCCEKCGLTTCEECFENKEGHITCIICMQENDKPSRV